MKDFTMRQVTYQSDDYPDLIEVVRMRTSSGSCSIIIKCCGQQIQITNEVQGGEEKQPGDVNTSIFQGDHYEQIAFALSEAIHDAAADRCELPRMD